MTNDEQVNSVRTYLERSLQTMREMRVSAGQGEKARRLSNSITYLETSCMWLNMSQFDKEYTPVLK